MLSRWVVVGRARARYVRAPDVEALRFALELNSSALDHILFDRAGILLDEAAAVLRMHIEEHGVDMATASAYVGILTNRATLRDLFFADAADTLASALDAGESAVSFARDALDSYRAHLGGQELHRDPSGQRLFAMLADALIALSEVYTDIGEPASSQACLAEARNILNELGDSERLADLDCPDLTVGLWFRPPRPSLFG